MDIVALEAKYENLYAPFFEIIVDGNDILKLGQNNTKESIEVSSVTIDNTLEGADTFSFTVNNAFDATKRELRSFIDQVLVFDAEVEIKLGYGSQRKTLMFGILTSVKVTFPSGSAPQIEVGGFDISYRMMKQKKPRSWNDKTDSEVVKILASEYRLNTSPGANTPFPQQESIENSDVKYPQIVKQEKENDFEFLTRLAERNYYEFFVFGETLFFRKPAYKTEPVVTLEWDKSLVSFSPEFNIAERVFKVDVMGQDTNNKMNIVGTARIFNDEIAKIFLGEIVKVIKGQKATEQLLEEQVKQTVSSEEHAKSLAKSILLKKNEEVLKGSGESIGIPDILAGTNIHLQGLGTKFSLTYYIDQTNHSISSSGYKTTFNVKKVPDENDITLTLKTTPLS
ncbi:contractile injection system protein, VgrG/Pvc8 family (plasmid) [Nostoc sp. UHCC 0926]|uniref:phage late control D family protein n=1 Tax=Nostoc sp. UHCC 0926 TaxID=3025190 RepID=UPI00235F7534|nr:contractile injection system protein, VgrG/Pvc8 family [Nostoc sp. UHCC 0926]WDD36386.1 contractile injection system protein, VgrG/Pvc8 family [Nostoc sp. UHCC 0926]